MGEIERSSAEISSFGSPIEALRPTKKKAIAAGLGILGGGLYLWNRSRT